MDAGCRAERRAFLRVLTAMTAGLAVVGCYGGPEPKGSPTAGNTPPPPPPPGNLAPVWQTVPTITFTQGVPSSVSIASYVSDPDGDPLTISMNGLLPSGVTFDAAGKRFVYDGVGTVTTVGGIVLTADDGRP
jgi:hypothetical protein